MKTGKLYNVIRSIQCTFTRHIFNDIGMSTVLEPSDLGIRTTIQPLAAKFSASSKV